MNRLTIGRCNCNVWDFSLEYSVSISALRQNLRTWIRVPQVEMVYVRAKCNGYLKVFRAIQVLLALFMHACSYSFCAIHCSHLNLSASKQGFIASQFLLFHVGLKPIGFQFCFSKRLTFFIFLFLCAFEIRTYFSILYINRLNATFLYYCFCMMDSEIVGFDTICLVVL